MESIFTCSLLFALVLLVLPLILCITHASKIKTLQATLQKLNARTAVLEAQLRGAETQVAIPVEPAATPAPTAVTPAPSVATPVSASFATILQQPAAAPAVAPSPKAPARPAAAPRAAIDWESFLGVKLFAWIGGFVLFLGVVFLVKYSFENNLVTPLMRVVIGAVIGCTLIGAGWFTARRNYRVPGQSLCATGVLVLYASIFGAHAFYNLISLPAAFALMSIVTIAAFLLAVRLDAQVVVVLGLLGGFLTPPLLTEAPDNALLLFGYVALLNTGIAAVVFRKKWDYLLVLAATGTVLTEVSWVPVLNVGKATTGFPIFLGMQALFLAIAFLRQKHGPTEKWSTTAATMLGFSAIGFGFWLLSLPGFADRPAFLFGYIFLADIGLLLLALNRRDPAGIAAPAGAAVFVWLALWTTANLTPARLWWGLGSYLLFAIIHAGFSVWPARIEAGRSRIEFRSYTPLLALVLLLLCVGRGQTSFAV